MNEHAISVRRVAQATLPTVFGVFRVIGYEVLPGGAQHLALVRGEVGGAEGVLVRVHSECLTGDVFGSRRCDCGAQLREALRLVAAEGRGVVLYLRDHEGRGIGLLHKLAAYALQENGRDTVEANEDLGLPVDGRAYGAGARILADLGITGVRLLTNNPAKRSGLERYGISVVECVPLQPAPTEENRRYLATKAAKLGHLLDLGGGGDG